MECFKGTDARFLFPARTPDHFSRPIATLFPRNASQVASQQGE